MSYQEIYARSMSDPEVFWAEAAKDIDWDRPWDKVLDDSNKPFYRWFVGGELNTITHWIAMLRMAAPIRLH